MPSYMKLWSSSGFRTQIKFINILIFRGIMLFMEVVFLHILICPGEAAPLGKSTCREIVHS